MTNKSAFLFSAHDFNRMFPFYFVLDEQLTIVRLGSSAQKLFLSIKDQLFSDHFEINRPRITNITRDNILSIDNKFTLLKAIQSGVVLRGQFMPYENNHLLFIGAPWFEQLQAFANSGLQLDDYAPHNPHLDLLHAINLQEIVNQEQKELLQRLNDQKNELLRVNASIAQISKTLQESNQRYEWVNRATSEAIWDWNIITGDVYYGTGFERLFGYATSGVPEKLDIWEQRIHPEDYASVLQQIRDAIESDTETWKAEYRYLKMNGEFAYVLDKGFIVREGACAIRMIGAMQDITIQKQEELHLKLLESVIISTNDSVLITEAKKGSPIIYVNPRFTDQTGYTLEEIKGKSPAFLQGPQSDKAALKQIATCIRNQTFGEITSINYKKNGEAYWCQFSVTPVFNDKSECTHWISVQRDVTELKEAEDELNRQKKFTEDIINNIPTDIAVFDTEHRYIFINPQAVKNKEIREWLIGKHDMEYAAYRGIDAAIFERRWALFEQAVKEGKTVQWIDEHQVPNQGSTFVLRNFYPYFEDGKLRFVIGYGIDITERKLIENKLGETLVSLKRSNEELEHFAYIASHDLQEPLRMVSSFLTQLEKKYNDKLDDRGREYVFYAVDGARRMKQIIMDLLEYSRAGRPNENIADIDTGDVVREVELLLSRQIADTNALIQYEQLPVVRGHMSPIRQVFQNLIGNSIKYHREGVPPVIRITAEKEQDHWHFSIADNGIGIDPSHFQKIFVIFQRLHHRDEYSGTGIGLAITKKIVEAVGGRIWVTTNDNHGCTFHFTIPSSLAEPANETQSEPD
ncbi:MAG: PAS domain S-box protein [Ferruginibacter sp.]